MDLLYKIFVDPFLQMGQAPDLLVQPKVGSFRALGFLQASAILRAADHVKAELKEKLGRMLM